MKRLVAVITLFIICTGCNFSTTTGSIIPKYGNPKTALLVLDMQEDLVKMQNYQLIKSKYLLLLQL